MSFSSLINIYSLYLLSQLLSTITEKKNFQDIIYIIMLALLTVTEAVLLMIKTS